MGIDEVVEKATEVNPEFDEETTWARLYDAYVLMLNATAQGEEMEAANENLIEEVVNALVPEGDATSEAAEKVEEVIAEILGYPGPTSAPTESPVAPTPLTPGKVVSDAIDYITNP